MCAFTSDSQVVGQLTLLRDHARATGCSRSRRLPTHHRADIPRIVLWTDVLLADFPHDSADSGFHNITHRHVTIRRRMIAAISCGTTEGFLNANH